MAHYAKPLGGRTYSMTSIPTATGSTGMTYVNLVRLPDGALSVAVNANGDNIHAGGEVTLYEDDYVRITIGTVQGQAQQRAYYCKKTGMRISYKSADGAAPSGLDGSGWTTATVNDLSVPALRWTATYGSTYYVLVTA